ncbi:MAG: aminoglycoside phosphotransferase family protein [Bacillota bacterium]
MDELFQGIPGTENWASIKLIDRGWSDDIKYHIVTKDNHQLLLRISDISCINGKKEGYEALRSLDSDIMISKPLDFGTCNNERSIYMLLTWLEGADAEEILPGLANEKQYELGYKTGQTLRKIHRVPAPSSLPAWSDRFNNKIDRKIRNYEKCAIKIEKADRIIKYINSNRYLLENRVQTFQHGDFHIGNMIITEQNEIGIIDFNRCDYGDPWEEFNRIVWCAKASCYFASGRINGYFEGKIPDEFFRLLALYIGNNTLSSVPWAVPFGDKEVGTMLEQAKDVMDWYSDFDDIIPKWYIPHNEVR